MFKNFINRILSLLLYGGTSKEQYSIICEDIRITNRKSIVIFSFLSAIMTGFLFFAAHFSKKAVVVNNTSIYLFAFLMALALSVLNQFVSGKAPIVLSISQYVFIYLFFSVGIIMAKNNYLDSSVSYMVLLFAIPLLVIIRPICLIAIVLSSDLVYYFVMRGVQAPELLSSNTINLLAYSVISIVTSTSVVTMKIQKIEAEHQNQQMLFTDMLTNLYNRHAYTELAKSYESKTLEQDIFYVALDVNGLKKANDTFGHSAGDALIISAAQCIQKAFGEYGKLFRIGGDEFAAMLHISEADLKKALDVLEEETANCKTIEPGLLSISVGYSSVNDLENGTFEDLARLSDERMYQNKAAYYLHTGKDRRR